MGRILTVFLALVICGVAAVFALVFMRPPQGAQQADVDSAPRNVIFLIGDGMGPQQMGLLFDWASAAQMSPTALERMSHSGTLGMMRTGAHNSPLTDSAAAATALATGVATNNGFVGMDPQGEPLPTALEVARDRGFRTGLVSTSRLTHATPASFASHVTSRDNETVIAQQLLESRVDVMLGGGSSFFLPEEEGSAKDRRSDIQAGGYHLVRTEAELLAVPADTERVLGLFHPSHLPYAIDRDEPDEEQTPSLPALTKRALELLPRSDRGFFLMIEGARIDHGGHMNDVAAVLGEMREFDACVALALEYQEQHPDTLVLVTADHETGGLSLTRSLSDLKPEHFLSMARAKQSLDKVPDPDPDASYDQSVYGVGRYKFYLPRYWRTESRALQRSCGWNASFATGQHTTTPVAVLAQGPGEAAFRGIYRNTYVGQRLLEWMSAEVP